MNLIARLCALCVLLVAAFAPAGAAAQDLRGDPRAVAAVERMFERFGGRDVWASARTIHVEYNVWRTEPDEHLIERAWRDMRTPNQRIEMQSPSAPFVWAFTPESAWVERGGVARAISAENHANALGFWPYDFYTMLHRLAAGDEEIELAFEAPRRVLARSRAGADWGWWEIDANGALLRWGAPDGDDTLEYVYGPVRRFGPIAFPTWGAATNGSWRFEYARIELSDEPIDAALLAQPG
ncbi:MAG: hypothetical protein AB7J28_06555 [Hyphomonadaceae bacterium]